MRCPARWRGCVLLGCAGRGPARCVAQDREWRVRHAGWTFVGGRSRAAPSAAGPGCEDRPGRRPFLKQPAPPRDGARMSSVATAVDGVGLAQPAVQSRAGARSSRVSAALLKTQSDARLSVLAADGSEAALETLIARYRRPLQ